MEKVYYEINVSYMGKHECTVTVDKNGPDNTTLEHAKSAMRALDQAWNFAAVANADNKLPYQFSLQEIRVATSRTTLKETI